MNPPPRPPSPAARAAAQRATRRANPNKLSTRDAQILMGIPSPDMPPPSYALANGNDRPRLKSLGSNSTLTANPTLGSNPPHGANSTPGVNPTLGAQRSDLPTLPPPRPSRETAIPESEPVSRGMQTGVQGYLMIFLDRLAL
jgi:hypothetical protein